MAAANSAVLPSSVIPLLSLNAEDDPSLSSDDEVVGMDDLDLSSRNVHSTTRHMWINRFLLLGASAFFLVCVIILGIYVSFSAMRPETQLSRSSKHPAPVVTAKYYNSTFWLFDDYVMEGSVQLKDVNRDGVLDAIFPLFLQSSRLAKLWRAAARDHRSLDPDGVCEKLNLSAPCLGRVVAVDGITGQLLWTVPAHQSVFVMSCDQLDVNGDGRNDCLAAGRRATMLSIDDDGTPLWRLNRGQVDTKMSVYRPLVVGDVDGDSTADLLIVQGGNSDYLPEEHDREGARLCLVSGSSGRLLAPCLMVPDGKESYMSPIRLRPPQGKNLILVGTGGETVEGSLFSMEEGRITEWYRQGHRIDVAGQLSKWMKIIYSGKLHKGVSVPPLVMNNGKKDEWFIVIGFDGIITAMNSSTMTPIWINNQFSNWETYSSPVSGNFNGDEILDIGLQMSRGSWPEYNSGVAVILDGRTGLPLWQMITDGSDMSSPLLVRVEPPNPDLFFFRVRTRRETSSLARTKRHGESISGNYQKKLISMVCRSDTQEETVRLIVVSGGHSPKVETISEFGILRYHYNINLTKDQITTEQFEDVSRLNLVSSSGKACSTLRAMELQTGAIAIDSSHTVTMYVPLLYQGFLLDDDLNLGRQKSQVILRKITFTSTARILEKSKQRYLQYLTTA